MRIEIDVHICIVTFMRIFNFFLISPIVSRKNSLHEIFETKHRTAEHHYNFNIIHEFFLRLLCATQWKNEMKMLIVLKGIAECEF